MRLAMVMTLALLMAPATSALGKDVRVEVEPGIEISIVDEGPRSADALVLIPGWGMSSAVWRKQIDHFAKYRRVLAIDPRSQGKSSVTMGDVSPEARARDLVAVLKARGIARATLVGWSQGVQDAAAYAALPDAPQLSSLVFVDALPSRGAERAAEDPGLAQNLRFASIFLAAPKAYAQAMVGAIFAQPLGPDERAALEADVLRTPPAVGAAAMLSSLYGRDRRSAVAARCLPTLLVVASGSAAAAEAASFTAAARTAQFKVIDKAGHALFYDQPDAFNHMLEEFMRVAEPTACPV